MEVNKRRKGRTVSAAVVVALAVITSLMLGACGGSSHQATATHKQSADWFERGYNFATNAAKENSAVTTDKRSADAWCADEMFWMAGRWTAPGGWQVEVVHLAGAPDNDGGQWIRVRRFGYWGRDCADLGRLAELIPRAELDCD